MTLQELHERIGWQLEGRLQFLGCLTNRWEDHSLTEPPRITDRADAYRRRPDAPPMPDEVWLPESLDLDHVPPHRGMKVDQLYGCKPVRYVRAGALLTADQIEWQYGGDPGNPWHSVDRTGVNYRIKP